MQGFSSIATKIMMVFLIERIIRLVAALDDCSEACHLSLKSIQQTCIYILCGYSIEFFAKINLSFYGLS